MSEHDQTQTAEGGQAAAQLRGEGGDLTTGATDADPRPVKL